MKTETENLRELDAWIAERVMGWRRSKIDTLTTGDSFYIHSREDVLIQYSYNRLKTFHPTTDPAAAMQVLEKCASEKCDMWGLQIFPPNSAVNIQWTVREPYLDDLQNPVIAEAETLPLAICKFAKQLFSK